MVQMASNVMDFFQQYSQMMLMQSMAAAVAGKSPLVFNPSMFGIPSSPPTSASPPSSSSPAIDSNSPLSQEQLMKSLSALANISNLLSASTSLKNEVSSSTSSSTTSRNSPTPMAQKSHRGIKVAVNRETTKPLQDWMNKNIRNPYPTSSEVKQLAQETGLSYTQIRNWFTNSRRRYEQNVGNSPLPWIKKDAPKGCQRSASPSSTSSQQSQESSEEASPVKSTQNEIVEDEENCPFKAFLIERHLFRLNQAMKSQ